MQAFGTELPYRAQAFGFDIRRSDNQAEVLDHGSRHEFGDTKYRRVVYHSVATTRFREFLPQPLTEGPANIQRAEQTTEAHEKLKLGLEHHIPSSARPAAPEVLYVLPTFRWERQDEGPKRTHARRGGAVRVWLRRPWFSSGDGEQLGVVLEPGVRLPRGWKRATDLELAAPEPARRPPGTSFQPLQRLGGVSQRAGLGEPSMKPAEGVFSETAESVVAAPPPTPKEARKMLRPYVSGWGTDPVWRSALPELPPTIAAFPRHAGYATGLTLEELPASVAVVVAAHDVHFDRERRLWYCDIEIDPGETYFPFVRLGLARYQSHSLPGVHLSRVVMTDFIQLPPDRFAELTLSESQAQLEVRGFSGRNVLPLSAALPSLGMGQGSGGESVPNTKVRVALERRAPGIPGELGWERTGSEVMLAAAASGFHITWTGTIELPPEAVEGGSHRLLLTEVEVYPRDLEAGDPKTSTSPLDFVRERVVYADTFEL